MKAKTKAAELKQHLITEDEGAMLDEAIGRIDQALPIIFCMSPKTSTNGHVTLNEARRRILFAQLAADHLLTDEGDDIRLGNGIHP